MLPGVSTRRDFLCGTARVLAAGAIAGVALPWLEGCDRGTGRARPRAYEAAFDVSALTGDGQSLVTPSAGMDGAPILIVRESRRRFVALSMLCTHEGCPLNPPVGGLITCPCHGSQFELDGRVHRGPAQLALMRYDATYDNKSKRVTVGADA